jgi:hypothetical protein
MNERIKELARESGLLVHNPEGVPTKLEKFSELLIEECISVVQNLSPGYKDYRDQIEDAFRRDCIEEMRKHFETKPKMRRTTREEKISRPGIYEVPSE